MRAYRIHLGRNVRQYRVFALQAQNDDHARELARSLDWDQFVDFHVEDDIADAIECPDPVLMIDEVDRATSKPVRTVDDGIEVPGYRPRSQDAAEFVKQVSRMHRYSSDHGADELDDAVVTMNDLIDQARKICGVGDDKEAGDDGENS